MFCKVFICVRIRIRGPQRRSRDDALWEEEVVEVFLDPFGDSLCYFEIEINPLNTVTDLFIRRTWTGLKRDLRWNCEGLVTACGTLAYGWVAAFQIPFASLGDCHPSRSPVWRVNFSRIDRPKDQPRELSAWSPTRVNSFHVPGRFGFLRFDQGGSPLRKESGALIFLGHRQKSARSKHQ